MKRKFSIFALLVAMLACLTFGLVACGQDEDEAGRVNPRIVVETDQTELALDILESDYTMPFAGVYYENLDRVDGVEVRMSLLDPTGSYIYENTLDYLTVRFPFTGKYELIYSAEGCEDFKITIYVCDRLEMGVDFTLTGNTLSWEPVFGASGYEVTVNGKEPTFTEEASFTSEIFAEQGFYVGVTAKGDNKVWIDSYMESYENRIPLQAGELAAFNNPCYALDIVPATPNTLNAPPSEIAYLTEEECAGSTGGAVRMLMKSGEYGTGLFRVKLQTTIDKEEEFDGMEVRFKLDSKSYIYESDGNDPTRFILAQPAADERRVGRGTHVYAGQNDCWQVVKIPKSAVEDFDGLKYLQFSLYNMTRSGGSGYLYLDYIHLYKDEVATPTGLAISEDKLTWTAVENARQYIVSVDKTENGMAEIESGYYYSNTAEIALTDIGVDVASETQQYKIKVMAVSDTASLGSSAWSEELAKRGTLAKNEVAAFDNALCATDITPPLLNEGTKTFSHLFWTGYEPVSGADGGYAVRLSMTAQSTYGTFSCFTVHLNKPLDLESEYDCVILRFKVEFTNYNNLDALSFQLVGSKQDNQNYNNGTNFRKPVKVGEWMEYQLTMDDLKTYYETGDTALSFQFTTTEANKSGSTVYSILALDYIRYYNSVAIPTNLRIEDKTLKWDAVENAGGYTVNINGVAYSGITETSYDLSGLTGANTLQVLAESAVSELASSVYSDPAYYEVLDENQLSTFNHKGYINKIVGGNPNTTNAQTTAEIRTADFDETIGTNGAVGLKLRADVSSWRSSGFSHIVTVTLEKPLDLTNNAGIKINFLAEWVTNPSATTEMRFMVLHATLIDMDYRAGEAKAGYVVVKADATKTNFQSLVVTTEQLKAIGYKDGDTYLTLNLWTNGDTKPGTGGSAYLWLDDISYCKMISAPASISLDGNLVKWSAVEGASGYIVSIDGEEITVTDTSYDLSAYAEKGAVVVRVCALPENAEEWNPSVWTSTVTKYFLKDSELATFNQEGYLAQIVAGNPNTTNAETKGSIRASSFNADKGTGGAVCLKLQGDTSSWRKQPGTVHIVTINLTKALDLTNNAGIKIKFLVEWISKPANTTEIRFLALNAKTIDNGYKEGNPNLGDGVGYVVTSEDGTASNFQTLTLTSAQLKSLGYEDGMTYLTVAVWTNGDTLPGQGGSAQFWLDDISYYKES